MVSRNYWGCYSVSKSQINISACSINNSWTEMKLPNFCTFITAILLMYNGSLLYHKLSGFHEYLKSILQLPTILAGCYLFGISLFALNISKWCPSNGKVTSIELGLLDSEVDVSILNAVEERFIFLLWNWTVLLENFLTPFSWDKLSQLTFKTMSYNLNYICKDLSIWRIGPAKPAWNSSKAKFFATGLHQ